MLKHFPPRRWNRTTAPLSAYRFEACNPDHRISSGQLGRPVARTAAAAAAVHSVHRTAPPQPTVGSLSLPLHTAHTTHTETSSRIFARNHRLACSITVNTCSNMSTVHLLTALHTVMSDIKLGILASRVRVRIP